MNSLLNVFPRIELQEILLQDLKYLAPIFLTNDDAELQRGIAALKRHLQRSKRVDFCTAQSSKAALCDKHMNLSAYLTRSMFDELRHMVTRETKEMAPYEEHLGKDEKDTLHRVRAMEGMWNERLSRKRQGTHRLSVEPWEYQSDACDACMLTRVATDATALQDLFAMYCSRPDSGAHEDLHPKLRPFWSNLSIFVCVWIFLSGAWEVFNRGLALAIGIKNSRKIYERTNFEMQPKRRFTSDASVQVDRDEPRPSLPRRLTKKQQPSSCQMPNQDDSIAMESDSPGFDADWESSWSSSRERARPFATIETSRCDQAVSPLGSPLITGHDSDIGNPNNDSRDKVQRTDSRRSNNKRNGSRCSTGNNSNGNDVGRTNSQRSTNNNNFSSSPRRYRSRQSAANNEYNDSDVDSIDNDNGHPVNNNISSGSIGNGSIGNGSIGNGSIGNGSIGNGSIGNGSIGNGSIGNGSIGNGSIGNSIQRGSSRRASSSPGQRARATSPATEDYRTATEDDNLSNYSMIATCHGLPEHPGLKKASEVKPKEGLANGHASGDTLADTGTDAMDTNFVRLFESSPVRKSRSLRHWPDAKGKAPVTGSSKKKGKQGPSIARRNTTPVTQDHNNAFNKGKLQKPQGGRLPSTCLQEDEATMRDATTQTEEVVCAYSRQKTIG